MVFVERKSRVIAPGDRFGRYLVEGVFRKAGSSHLYARVACDCGTTRFIQLKSLKSGHSRSCGCLHKQSVTKHGLWDHPIYGRWRQMMSRCYNAEDKRYARYGGRGVIVCARWHEPGAFISDMAGTYAPGMTIDRIDNDGPYSPENCRWATRHTQNRNYSRNILLAHDGQTLCLTDWADKLGMNYQTLWNRYRTGWTAERLLSTPVRKPR